MLEILLSGRKLAPAVSAYGPGPSTLLSGDTVYGYFGTVTEAEMGLNAEFKWLLYNSTTAESITVDAIVNTWFKFIINGRILFFPKLPLAAKITSADLYAVKAVFDAKETYKPTTQFPTGAAMYTQSLHVKNSKSHLFLVRLMDGIPDAFQNGSTTAFTPSTASEVSRTIGALITRTGAPDALGIRTFAWTDFNYQEGGTNYSETFVKEQATSGSTYEFSYNVNSNQLTWGSGTRAWRPMLEYIPADEQASLVFDLERFSITNVNMPQQTVATTEVTTELAALTNFANEVESEAVSPTAEFDAVYVPSLLGGFAVDNDFSNYAFSEDEDYALIDIAGTRTEDKESHVHATIQPEYALTDIVGATEQSMAGYITTS